MNLKPFSPLTPALSPLRGEGEDGATGWGRLVPSRPRPASLVLVLENGIEREDASTRDEDENEDEGRTQARATAPSPSPLNGERVGVRGETVRLATPSPSALLPFSISPFLTCLIALLVAFVTGTAHADIPAPDNLLYGTITLDGQPIGGSHTNITIEARRTLGSAPIASYRMGSDPDFGAFYVLKLRLEELSPISASDASLVGNSLFIVVRDTSGVRSNATFQIPERGTVARVDFGATPSGDTDNDGLPDAWELAQFGNLNRNGAFLGANGQTALANYLAGTDPNNPNDQFRLTITQTTPNKFVSFLARQTAGAGYEGRSRYYALEYTTNAAGPWLGVAHRTNILGNNSTITYQATEPGTPVFYRGQVRLQNP